MALQKRFKDFVEDVSKDNPAAKDLIHGFYAIVSRADYSDDDLRDFFSATDYKPTRKELGKISDLHDEFEELFDCEYKDY